MLPAFKRDAAATLLILFETYGDVARFKFGRRLNVFLAHPDHVRHVLIDNAANYTKGIAGDAFRPLLGNGLLTAEGEIWRRHREVIQPAFRAQRLNSYMAAVRDAARRTAERWLDRPEHETVIDLSVEMNRLTFGFIAQALIGIELGQDRDRIADAFDRANREGTHRLRSLIKFPMTWPTPHNRAYRAAIDTVRDFALGHLRERRMQGDANGDLLGVLAAADSPIGEQEAIDEVVTLLFAGHETTTNALSWAFGLLAKHPEMMERCRNEIETTLNGNAPGADDLGRLTFVRAVFQEAMRLYPPIYAFQRRAIAADSIGGFTVPEGSGVTVSPYVTHRHPAFWSEPERFDPERFVDARAGQAHRLAYIPFGAGQRTCIGVNLAMLEGVAILASLAADFDFILPKGELPATESLISLAPRGGMPIVVRRRRRS